MNFGKEGQGIGMEIKADFITRIIEEQDAFIIQHIIPYLEEETGGKIDKQDLKKALDRHSPTMVRYHGECPVCGLDLTTGSYVYDIGLEYCPRCGQRVKWPEAPEQGKKPEMMITHNDGRIEYITDIDSVGLLSSKDYGITYYGELKGR